MRVLYKRLVIGQEIQFFTETYNWMDLKLCLLENLVPAEKASGLVLTRTRKKKQEKGNSYCCCSKKFKPKWKLNFCYSAFSDLPF